MKLPFGGLRRLDAASALLVLRVVGIIIVVGGALSLPTALHRAGPLDGGGDGDVGLVLILAWHVFEERRGCHFVVSVICTVDVLFSDTAKVGFGGRGEREYEKGYERGDERGYARVYQYRLTSLICTVRVKRVLVSRV